MLTKDPFPYVGEYGSRHAYPGTLNHKRLTYDPRPEYDQTMSDNTNLCAECSSDGVPDETADVTHCENCGLPIQGRRSLWT